VEQGSVLDTYDDVSDGVRKQLYDEECQRFSKENISANNLTTGSTLPPININIGFFRPLGSTEYLQSLIICHWLFAPYLPSPYT
jgi:hypothetical protein